MARFDLIVIGAGPAGSTAARVAAGLGLRVALVDKARFPRDKLCGGAVTGRGLRYYAEAFGQPRPDVPFRDISAITFGADGADLATLPEVPPVHLTMRRAFDAALVAQALAAGAADYTGCRYSALDPDGVSLTIDGQVLQAELLVAADGVNSSVARQLYGSAFDKDRIGFALEVERPETGTHQELRIDFGAVANGYGWQFPKVGGVTVGIGGQMRRNEDFRTALDRYLTQLGLPGDSPVKGQFLPFGEVRRQPRGLRLVFAGDAAGLVDPVTGEGIAYAMRSGDRAARAAAEVLAQGAPRRFSRAYGRRMRPVHRAINQARMIHPLIYSPFFHRGFLAGFRASSSLRQDYMRLLAGETEYGAILRRVLRRLPAHVWRSLKPAF